MTNPVREDFRTAAHVIERDARPGDIVVVMPSFYDTPTEYYLRGRIPIHMGNGFNLAETGGVETVNLTVSQIPAHSHPFLASSDTANSPNPAANVVARSSQEKIFLSSNPSVAMSSQFLGSVGGSQPHSNFQPYLCVDFIISLFGIFPSQT